MKFLDLYREMIEFLFCKDSKCFKGRGLKKMLGFIGSLIFLEIFKGTFLYKFSACNIFVISSLNPTKSFLE